MSRTLVFTALPLLGFAFAQYDQEQGTSVSCHLKTEKADEGHCISYCVKKIGVQTVQGHHNRTHTIK